ncbi:hypothetical protein F4809DRAFT_586920 [Biscogniauxia mediterranea]|nr:hypothetical protein F4809DRAFT_586920 [Biscogniauxia mediterranea]
MQLQSLIAAAGLAASTQALLLPPEISSSENDMVTTLPVPTDTNLDIPMIAESQSLKLKCPGCPVRLPHHWKGHSEEERINTHIPSHLALDFKVDSSESVDRLLLNGFELYPNSDPFGNVLTAAVQPDIPDRRKKLPSHFKGPRPLNIQPLGFGLQTNPVVTSDEDALELVNVELQIIEVGNVFVDGVPNVQVKLVKTPAGKLMIGAIETTDSETPQNPMDKQEECATMLCKWKAMVMQRINQLRKSKGCGRMKGLSQSDGAASDNNQHKHRFALLLKTAFSHILVPIVIGIMAGVAAGMLGMLVGTFIVFVWHTFVRRSANCRRNRAHGHCHKASRQETAAADEKSGLMEDQEEADVESPPPSYVESGVVAADAKQPENDA